MSNTKPVEFCQAEDMTWKIKKLRLRVYTTLLHPGTRSCKSFIRSLIFSLRTCHSEDKLIAPLIFRFSPTYCVTLTKFTEAYSSPKNWYALSFLHQPITNVLFLFSVRTWLLSSKIRTMLFYHFVIIYPCLIFERISIPLTIVRSWVLKQPFNPGLS